MAVEEEVQVERGKEEKRIRKLSKGEGERKKKVNIGNKTNK